MVFATSILVCLALLAFDFIIKSYKGGHVLFMFFNFFVFAIICQGIYLIWS